jgi:hypothetical protein
MNMDTHIAVVFVRDLDDGAEWHEYVDLTGLIDNMHLGSFVEYCVNRSWPKSNGEGGGWNLGCTIDHFLTLTPEELVPFLENNSLI